MIKEYGFAIFNFEECDSDLIDELASYLDEHAEEVFSFFEVERPEKKIEIKIFPTKKEYDEQYKIDSCSTKEVPSWVTGHYNTEGKRIRLLSIHDFKNTANAIQDGEYAKKFGLYKKTLVHEFVHYVNDLFRDKHKCSYTEKYLQEGIATYLSGEMENRHIAFDFSIENLLEKGIKCYYTAYFLITKYFVENYDKEYVLEIFQSNRQARELLKDELFEKAQKFYKDNEKTF